MRLFFVVTSLLFFTFEAAADFNRKTTFEDRITCEVENRGVWREFGDICADSCESKFDKLKICDRAITFNCDCGVGRCWRDKKCILISDYKKIYEANAEKEEAKMSQEKKEREAMAKANAEMIAEKLIMQAGGRAMSSDIEGASNNYSNFYNSSLQNLNNQASEAVNRSIDRGSGAVEKLIPIPESPPIVIDSSDAGPTPAFLQQEINKNIQGGENIDIQNSVKDLPSQLPTLSLP